MSKTKKNTLELELLNFIKNNSNNNGEFILTDYQIGMKLYGNFDIKTRVKITSAMTRLKKKNSIESKYSRVIFTRDD